MFPKPVINTDAIYSIFFINARKIYHLGFIITLGNSNPTRMSWDNNLTMVISLYCLELVLLEMKPPMTAVKLEGSAQREENIVL